MYGRSTYLGLCVLMLGFVQGITHGADPDPVGWWKFDDGSGTVARDSSANRNDGTLYGDPQWVAGQLAGALQLDGNDDYVELPIGSVMTTLREATLTLWVNWSGLGGSWQRIIDFGSGTSAYLFLCPNNGANGAMRTSTTVGGVWNEYDSSAGPLATGWHHITITISGSAEIMTTYVDGEVVGSMSNITNTLDELGETTQNWIGRSQYVADPYFNGAVDDLRIYDVILSEDSIERVMQGLAAEAASNPTPADGAIDVPRDVLLSWTPGEFAESHDVYFGTALEDVNAADRANPLGVLASQGQTATTYDPEGILEFEQTYYWRVDEVNAAPDNTIFRGEVWSFTAEPLAYPVENVVATTNATSDAGFSPEQTIDGSGLNADGQHSTLNTDMWAGSPPAGELAYIEYDFGKVYKLYEMHVWNYNVLFELMLGFGFKDVTIAYSVNGTDWTTLADVQFAQGTARSDYTANTIVDLGGVAARFVRLTANTGHGPMGQFGLSEVRFLYTPAQAREPEPADGAAGVSVDAMLGWRAGREAASHEVYFGTDAETPALVDTVADSVYDPGALDLGTTYYWQIVEVNEAETVSAWTGDLWSFSTQEFIAIDDFEGYNDEDTLIYETWIDGWVNGTGSTVGHLEAPFVERSIVHSGAQSMPLFYDNTGTASSEADLALAQDWTAHRIQSLSLYLRGATDNSGGQLYVTINDTKVPYDGDASTIRSTVWQPWNIDLAAIGGNLQNVTKLTIGIEGAGAQGIVYLDDIRLYPHTPETFTPAEPDSATLVAHYALEGNANDSSGNGYHGTEIDGVTYVVGIDGQGLQLDGLYDYIDFGTPAGWPAGLAPRTLCGWAMTTTVNPGWRWIAAYGTGATGQAMFIGLNGPSLYGGGYGDDVMVADFWAEDEWHHIALTYDGTTARLYADGVEVATEAKNWNLVPDRAHIGRQVNDEIEFWAGVVDEVRLYNQALSLGEIAWLAGRRAPVHKPF
ncbi:MAG: discoidin domain-containing protein [Phycisphaerales bacterium]|nr:MAG: discoidin domain-containing protein [Phycisphaerales bacterium]